MTSPTVPTPTDSDRLARRKVLGFGLRCDPVFPGVDTGRDLRLRNGPHGLDLDQVEGIDCLTQDLAIAVTTLRGSDVLNTDFGFDGLAAMAEERLPSLVQERVRAAVVTTLARDPRVRRIVDVKVEDARLDVPLPGSRELGVRVSFETLTDDKVAIDLGRAAPVG
jgi:phage baseplate assembly protein W